MRTVLTVAVFFNQVWFYLNALYAGMAIAYEMWGPAAVFAGASLLHKVIADNVRRVRDEKFPLGKDGPNVPK